MTLNFCSPVLECCDSRPCTTILSLCSAGELTHDLIHDRPALYQLVSLIVILCAPIPGSQGSREVEQRGLLSLKDFFLALSFQTDCCISTLKLTEDAYGGVCKAFSHKSDLTW